jgi:hypothetical protein
VIEKSSRGAAFGDYDNDGDIDALVDNMKTRPPYANDMLRNDTARHAALAHVRLVGTKSNRDAIGAKVIVESAGRRQTALVPRRRQLYVAQRCAGALRAGRDHKGESDRDTVAKRTVQNVGPLAVDQFYVVKEGLRRAPDY